ncbi:ABC transporter ATP-binding protein, partial [Klebsiella pneumoniae]|uniref:ABC transporter permease subunit n=2 Tax=Gammaproteobacteria TaxID=1236 RepID=UPI00275EF0CA|nr:ABC transporter ATP-binding protein [Klebsiella pneumoniae]
ALLAAGCGVVLGAPTLRLRGDYLAIVTLGFGEIIRILLRNLDRPVNITNGPKGISQVDPVSLLGVNLGRTQELFGLRLPSVYLY